MAPTVTADPAEQLQGYAHPERLVTTEWLAAHLNDKSVVVAESDEDVLLYDTGHIPGAVKLDWQNDLNDTVARDYVDADGFSSLMSKKGISRDTTIVIYGDNFNWWAAYALWVCSLFGHEDVRLLNGGRQKWIAEGRPLTKDVPNPQPTSYPRVERDDSKIRAFRDHVLSHIREHGRLIDVRSPKEYSGELLHMADHPQEGALRGGHIPTAKNVPWKTAANDDGTFKGVDELKRIYLNDLGIKSDENVIAYCRIGERSSHTWFVLTHLLGLGNVRNYDGSWVEWGNLVGVPIEKPGQPVRPALAASA